MQFTIHAIEKKDNKGIEAVIRACLIEFEANCEGTTWTDSNLGRFSEIYNSEGNQYWVVENEKGQIVGGAGIGQIPGVKDICELQKMYCLPEARGTGASHALMDTALEYAKKYYAKCYLETRGNMVAAQRFYEKYGFARTYDAIAQTEHCACDVHYIKDLGK